ncbi:hypothetical protein BGZ65_007847, partial [Modicella reniformis]
MSSTIDRRYREWTERLQGKIDVEAFVSKFGFTDRRDAHRQYLNLITQNWIKTPTQLQLESKFKSWKVNSAEVFWKSRENDVKLDTVILSAEGAIIKNAGQNVIDRAAKRQADSSQESVTDDFLTDGPVVSGPLQEGTSVPSEVDTPAPLTAGKRKRPPKDSDASKAEEGVDNKKKKGFVPFSEIGRRSLQRRYSTLGLKWVLESGTIVEDVLFAAGEKLSVYHPIQSFMIDIQDRYTQGLFSEQDWTEIKRDIPSSTPYTEAAVEYLDTFDTVTTINDLRTRLRTRPDNVELELIHTCLVNWLNLYETETPSPFSMGGNLPELWWVTQAWGVCSQLAKGVPGSFILMGEMTGIDSTARRNNKDRITTPTPHATRKKLVRADLIWRSMIVPGKNWGIGEAARVWDEPAQKYVHESTFKLPRQLHDVLVARTQEVGGADRMRDVLVSGLVIAGPCIQRIALCWSAKGTNVTRLVRSKMARLDSSVKNMSTSLLALHQILLFRSSTMHLMQTYDRANELCNEERRQDRHRQGPEEWADGDN